jgi:hypothetical protein
LASASLDRLSPESQKFFGSFFQKRTASCRLPLSAQKTQNSRDSALIVHGKTETKTAYPLALTLKQQQKKVKHECLEICGRSR